MSNYPHIYSLKHVALQCHCHTEREMECFRLCSSTSTPPTLPFHKAVINLNGHNFPSNFKNPKLFCPALSTPKYTVNCNCRERTKGEAPLFGTSAYAVLGVEPDCSAAELKAAFEPKYNSSYLIRISFCFPFLCVWLPRKFAEKKGFFEFWVFGDLGFGCQENWGKKKGVLGYGFLLFLIWLPGKLRKTKMKMDFWFMGFCCFGVWRNEELR